MVVAVVAVVVASAGLAASGSQWPAWPRARSLPTAAMVMAAASSYSTAPRRRPGRECARRSHLARPELGRSRTAHLMTQTVDHELPW
eukprot:5179632-Pyramimonas_sp.AAC.1